MDLRINQRLVQGICILDLHGRVVCGESEAMVRDRVAVSAAAGVVNVVLNLENATELDDDGLNALGLCNALLRKAGGTLKLLNIERVRTDLAVLLKLGTEFESFTSERDAISSFFPDPMVRRYDILEFIREQPKHHSPDSPDSPV